MASVSNLYIDQGSDFSSIITLTNQDGTVMNLTDFTVQSQFRKSYQSSSFVAFVAVINDAANGKVQLKLSADASSAVQAGRYLYDVEIRSSIGERKRVLEGIVILTPEITR